MSECASSFQMMSFARGDLGRSATQAIDAHIETCQTCAAAIAESDVHERLVEALRESEASRCDNENAVAMFEAARAAILAALLDRS